jgi:hypothetical protein
MGAQKSPGVFISCHDRRMYSAGKVYRIVSKQSDKVYIGSTVKTLAERYSKHVQCYRNYQKNEKHYITSCELLKFGDAEIQLIEDFPCESRAELERREGFHIRQNIGSVVNKHILGRTLQETRAAYRRSHRDQIKRYATAKHECRCGEIYTAPHKARHETSMKHKNATEIIVA